MCHCAAVCSSVFGSFAFCVQPRIPWKSVVFRAPALFKPSLLCSLHHACTQNGNHMFNIDTSCQQWNKMPGQVCSQTLLYALACGFTYLKCGPCAELWWTMHNPSFSSSSSANELYTTDTQTNLVEMPRTASCYACAPYMVKMYILNQQNLKLCLFVQYYISHANTLDACLS